MIDTLPSSDLSSGITELWRNQAKGNLNQQKDKVKQMLHFASLLRKSNVLRLENNAVCLKPAFVFLK